MGGLKGRRHRINRFEARAEGFLTDVLKRRNVKSLRRDSRPITVGKGKNKRLIYKPHLNLFHKYYPPGKFQEYLNKNKITPKHYVFVPVHGEFIDRGWPKAGVQEYFHRPSVNELEYFLISRFWGNKPQFLNKEERLLCKQFVNQHLGKNLKKEELLEIYGNLCSARRELSKDLGLFSGMLMPISSNLLAMGVTKDGKFRLTIVDG